MTWTQFDQDNVYKKPAVSWQEFNTTLNAFEQIMLKQLANSQVWLEKSSAKVWSTNAWKADFTPYVQRLTVAPGDHIIMWGDLHGSYNSLQKSLTTLRQHGYLDAQLRVTDPSHHLIFLGDLVDRGPDSTEVLDLVMKLKINNPNNVIIVRGNHEDGRINERYGFGDELRNKYGLTTEQLAQVYRIYDLLPVALYLSSGQNPNTQSTILCTHGAYEVGFNPKKILQMQQPVCFQMIDRLERFTRVMDMDTQFQTALIEFFGLPTFTITDQNEPTHELCSCKPHNLRSPYTLGFAWHDFVDDNSSTIVDYRLGRGWVYGQALTQYLLAHDSSEHNQLIGIFRAHQHNGLMLEELRKQKGIVKLWDGLVHTIVSGLSAGGAEVDGTFALVVPGVTASDWKIYHGGDDFKCIS